MLVSPYVRTRETAALIARAAGMPIEPGRFVADERLREKELGILDLLTERASQRTSPSRPGSGACSASSTTGRPAARAGAT